MGQANEARASEDEMIFYTVDTNRPGFPVRYIDQAGLQQSWPGTFQDAGEALRRFETAHSGAVYLTLVNFNRKLEALAVDRAKLAAWQRWARPGAPPR